MVEWLRVGKHGRVAQGRQLDDAVYYLLDLMEENMVEWLRVGS